MRCLACKNMFRVKITWSNIFLDKKYYLCDECTNKYKVNYNYVTIPLDSLIEIFYIFDTTYDVNPISFLLERRFIFEFILKKYNLNKIIFLYYDTFNDFYNDIDNINELALFNRKIVVLVTYFSNL